MVEYALKAGFHSWMLPYARSVSTHAQRAHMRLIYKFMLST